MAANVSNSSSSNNNNNLIPSSGASMTLSETLQNEHPEDGLLELSRASLALAASLAQELDKSLAPSSLRGSTSGGNIVPAAPSSGQVYTSPRVPFPKSIRMMALKKEGVSSRLLGTAAASSASGEEKEGAASSSFVVEPEAVSSASLETATVCSESILSSLTKVATGGSRASQEMRQLEQERGSVDQECADVRVALQLRRLASAAAEALGARRYTEAAAAVRDYKALPGKTTRAVQMAGVHTVRAYQKTRDVLQRTILERYQSSIQANNLASVSELTPLLGNLDLAHKGVGLYMTYSQNLLTKAMSLEEEVETEEEQTKMRQEEADGVRISRAEARRREARAKPTVTVCTKLAKVYNAAVTHLRHHLPMVAYALGDADGDAALVKLVHTEAERRAVRLIRDYIGEKKLPNLAAAAARVASKMEDRFVGGSAPSGGGGIAGVGGSGSGFDALLWGSGGSSSTDDSSGGAAMALLGLGGAGAAAGAAADAFGAAMTSPRTGVFSSSSSSSASSHAKKKAAAIAEDCGFTAEVGKLAEVDAAMSEAALMLQHTESYVRFVRHAVDEVKKARQLRQEKKAEQQGEQKGDAQGDRAEANNAPAGEIIPLRTQLTEVVAESGGYYVTVEHSLLLAGMQRAFIDASLPDERNYSPITIVSASTAAGSASSSSSPSGPAAGSCALQTSVVEECLFAAQRSTLRAFATGDTGTACAAANFCVDTLGRVLLEVLTRRAEMSTSLLKPGDGLLPASGQSGLGQAALAMVNSAQKMGLRGAAGGRKPGGAGAGGGVGGVGGGAGGHSTDEAAEQQRLARLKIETGVARACASFNDLEVAVDYCRRLEAKFTQEVDTTFGAHFHETEQLRLCVRAVGPSVTEPFGVAADRAVDQLLSTMLLPRVRSIVQDVVGAPDGGGGGGGGPGGGPAGGASGASSAGFMSGATSVVNMGGVAQAGSASSVRMNYNLDDAAFELAQVGEGYMGRLCSLLDELIEPLRLHLAPRLADAVLIGIMGGASKRLEAAIRRCHFTALGALSLDSDIRLLMNYAKDHMDAADLQSNVALQKACHPLARLSQIALLMNVDDLEDVLDLISASKRKGHWDLKLEEAKSFLNLRVDFEGRKVNELLRLPEHGEE